MKALMFLTFCVTSAAFAEDFKTLTGKEFKNASVIRVERDGVVLRTRFGVSKVYFVELPKNVQERFHYDDPAKVEVERAAKTAAAQLAKAEQRAQQRAEKEQNARAILMKAEQQFKAAERRAAEAHRSSGKGTLSGQVFVATKGGENVKLGARQVSLFDRYAVAILAAGLKAFADAKNDQLQLDITAAEEEEKQAEAAEEQARTEEQQVKVRKAQANLAEDDAKATEESIARNVQRGFLQADSVTALNAARAAANQAREAAEAVRRDLDAAREAQNKARETADTARARIEFLRAEKAYYYSEEFLFSQLRDPIQTVDTDAEGKFIIRMPKAGAYVVAAQTQRLMWNDTEKRRMLPGRADISDAGATENYYWLQVVSLDGQEQRVQNLSNTNLGGTVGISSRIPLTH